MWRVIRMLGFTGLMAACAVDGRPGVAQNGFGSNGCPTRIGQTPPCNLYIGPRPLSPQSQAQMAARRQEWAANLPTAEETQQYYAATKAEIQREEDAWVKQFPGETRIGMSLINVGLGEQPKKGTASIAFRVSGDGLSDVYGDVLFKDYQLDLVCYGMDPLLILGHDHMDANAHVLGGKKPRIPGYEQVCYKPSEITEVAFQRAPSVRAFAKREKAEEDAQFASEAAARRAELARSPAPSKPRKSLMDGLGGSYSWCNKLTTGHWRSGFWGNDMCD